MIFKEIYDCVLPGIRFTRIRFFFMDPLAKDTMSIGRKDCEQLALPKS